MKTLLPVFTAMMMSGGLVESPVDDRPVVSESGPDLIVESLILRGRSGNRFRFEYQVKNVGNSAVQLGHSGGGAIRTSLQTRLSKDRRWSRDDDPSGGWSFPVRDRSPLTLRPGDTYGTELEVRRKRQGDRYLLLMVDSQNRIDETNEENNIAALDLESKIVPKLTPGAGVATTPPNSLAQPDRQQTSDRAPSDRAPSAGASAPSADSPTSSRTGSSPIWIFGLFFLFIILGSTGTAVLGWIIVSGIRRATTMQTQAKGSPVGAQSYKRCDYCGATMVAGKDCRKCGAPVT